MANWPYSLTNTIEFDSNSMRFVMRSICHCEVLTSSGSLLFELTWQKAALPESLSQHQFSAVVTNHTAISRRRTETSTVFIVLQIKKNEEAEKSTKKLVSKITWCEWSANVACFFCFFFSFIPIIIGLMKNWISPIIKAAYIVQSDSFYLAPVSLFSFHSMSSTSGCFFFSYFFSVHSVCVSHSLRLYFVSFIMFTHFRIEQTRFRHNFEFIFFFFFFSSHKNRSIRTENEAFLGQTLSNETKRRKSIRIGFCSIHNNAAFFFFSFPFCAWFHSDVWNFGIDNEPISEIDAHLSCKYTHTEPGCACCVCNSNSFT